MTLSAIETKRLMAAPKPDESDCEIPACEVCGFLAVAHFVQAGTVSSADLCMEHSADMGEQLIAGGVQFRVSQWVAGNNRYDLGTKGRAFTVADGLENYRR